VTVRGTLADNTIQMASITPMSIASVVTPKPAIKGHRKTGH
jgi:hypothetical protein